MQYLVQEYDLQMHNLSPSYYAFNAWMTIEICYMPVCVVTNIFFLFIRAFTFEKMECRMVNLLVTEEHDFI